MALPASHPVSALDAHRTLGSTRGSFASELPMVLTMRAALSSVPQPSAERLVAGRNSIADCKIARP